MKLKNIDIHIFKILLANNKITVAEIVKIYNESDNNVKSSLNRLNAFLNKFQYGYILKENISYTLFLSNINSFNEILKKSPTLSSEERIDYLLMLLAFEKKINICNVAKYFNITRNALSSDIKFLKNKLLEQNLHLESIPWKGLYLKGEYRDIYLFSIKTILKFLVKKESNQILYKIYENLINSTMKDYYNSFISEKQDYNFSKLSVKILKVFNIEIDLYGVNTLKAIFIFLFLNKKNSIYFRESFIFKKKFKNIEPIYKKINKKFNDLNILSDYVFLIENIDFLIISIIILQKKLLFLEIKKSSPAIIRDIEDLLNIRFSTSDKIEFITLLDISNFNYEHDIYNYHKIPKNKLKFPEFLIEILKNYTLKYNYKVLPQDFYILAHFLYNLIFNTYLKILINKKILILDYSNNNWIGTNIKNRLYKNFNFKNIEISSVYMLDFFDFNTIESYDFIIYSPYSDTTILPNGLSLLKDKLIILDYLDYFEASYLINKLLFNQCFHKTN